MSTINNKDPSYNEFPPRVSRSIDQKIKAEIKFSKRETFEKLQKIKKSYSRKYTNRICFDIAELQRKQYTEKKDLKKLTIIMSTLYLNWKKKDKNRI